MVAPLVVASALYALWAMLTPGFRLKALALAERCLGANKIILALRRRTVAALASSCGSCGAKATLPPKPAKPLRS